MLNCGLLDLVQSLLGNQLIKCNAVNLFLNFDFDLLIELLFKVLAMYLQDSGVVLVLCLLSSCLFEL